MISVKNLYLHDFVLNVLFPPFRSDVSPQMFSKLHGELSVLLCPEEKYWRMLFIWLYTINTLITLHPAWNTKYISLEHYMYCQ